MLVPLLRIQLDRQPKRLVIAATTLLVVVITLIDFGTIPEISLGMFYLLPVMLCAWVCSQWQRLAICLISGTAWLMIELVSGAHYSETWIVYWNALLRLGIFILACELTAGIAGRNAALEREIGERNRAELKLKELNETLEQKVADRTAAAERRSVELAQSEAALRRQAEVLESILNSMGDGVIVTDSDGKVLLCNPEAERLLGVTADQATFQRWLEHQESYPAGRSSYERARSHPLISAIRGERVDGIEIYIRHEQIHKGSWVRIKAGPLSGDRNRVGGNVIVFTDMTLRKNLEKQVAEISEREQRRIGQDLHDGVCQHLVSTAYAANMLAETLTEKGLADAKQAVEISGLIKDAILQARNLARALYPVDLTADGLVCALEELAQSVRDATDIDCRFTTDGQALVQDQTTGINLYRIAQEAVNNALKHSQSRQISIDLSKVQDGLLLRIQDYGVGIQTGAGPRKGIGLDIMNYRAGVIGALLDVQSEPGQGTTINCCLRGRPATI